MKLSDFDYHLPPEHIAQQPLALRDHSKLMLVDRAQRSYAHHQFFELPDLLDPNSILVFNHSKVIPARLRFKIGEVSAEVLLIKPISPTIWECMISPGRKFKVGSTIKVDENLSMEVMDITPHGLRRIEFFTEDLAVYLEKNGQIPLPPYIKQAIDDASRYQTVYAKTSGSVAAPTAGFHFTDQVFQNLEKKGIQTAFVTLHVGLGTFQPVKVEEVETHKMHSERFELSEETAKTLNEAKKAGKKIVAVGTTTVRVLESCTDSNGQLQAKVGETDIFIRPGYQWKFVDELITNFHVPKSTLLMLVSALANRELILEAYEEAKRENYRFFSFGDSMYIK